MRRYRTAMGRMSAGTCNSRSRGVASRTQSRENATENAVPAMAAVETCRSTSLWSPAPNAVLTRMPAPRHMPLMKRMASVISGLDVPTAARASSPTNLPTMMLSAALYVSWNKLPSTRGMVNLTSSGVIAPVVMSFVMGCFPLFPLSHKLCRPLNTASAERLVPLARSWAAACRAAPALMEAGMASVRRTRWAARAASAVVTAATLSTT